MSVLEAIVSRRLLVSTRNPHKLLELRTLLAPLGLAVETAADAGVPEVEETGSTYADNALLKAAAAWNVTPGLCLADDSGLSVDALDGAPGVMSARFAGEDVTYEDNNRALLRALTAVPEPSRGAAFVCTLALLVPEQEVRGDASGRGWGRVQRPDVPRGAALFVVRGEVRGRILDSPRGAEGFGYDPLFLYEPAGQTFAQMASDAKNAVSHRGQGLTRLADCLATVLGRG